MVFYTRGGYNPDSKLVVADSGSTDKTHLILECLQKELPQLVVLSDTEKYHGSKVIALYKYAIQNGADYIFQTDSDGQTNPDEFLPFWKTIECYEAVIGCRRIRGDGRIRAFIERIVCFLLKIYFGVDVPDANAPFRLMKSSLVKKYIDQLPENYNLPNIMLTAYFAYYQENVIFKDITFKPRQGGINSINLWRIFKIGWNAIGDFRMFQKAMRYKEKNNYKYN